MADIKGWTIGILIRLRQTIQTGVKPTNSDVDGEACFVLQVYEERSTGAFERCQVCPGRVGVLVGIVAVGPGGQVLGVARFEHGDLAVADVSANGVVRQELSALLIEQVGTSDRSDAAVLRVRKLPAAPGAGRRPQKAHGATSIKIPRAD